MQINEQIREHRKKIGLTQEQIASYLGVSTPAVNKWEKGVTYPDVSLLAPLARLLEIDLNTLFAFHENLSKMEIGLFCNEVGKVINDKGFQAGFEAATAKLQEYPTCELLRYSIALLLEGGMSLATLSTEERERYEYKLMEWYEQAASGQNEETREAAISMLVNKYLACGQIEKAQEMSDLLPDKRTVDKQMLKINIFMKQEKNEDAAALAETKIFSDIATLQNYFIKLVDIEIILNEIEVATRIADISQQIAMLLDLWEYNAYVCPLQVSVASKDTRKSIDLIKNMLKAVTTPIKATKSVLFQHLPTKNMDDFGARAIPLLLHEFETENQYEFLRSNSEFQDLIDTYKKQFPLKDNVL